MKHIKIIYDLIKKRNERKRLSDLQSNLSFLKPQDYTNTYQKQKTKVMEFKDNYYYLLLFGFVLSVTFHTFFFSIVALVVYFYVVGLEETKLQKLEQQILKIKIKNNLLKFLTYKFDILVDSNEAKKMWGEKYLLIVAKACIEELEKTGKLPEDVEQFLKKYKMLYTYEIINQLKIAPDLKRLFLKILITN
jgi:hypothetical protein